MKGWKIGALVSFSIVTLVYGAIIYSLSLKQSVSSIFSVLKTYPIILLIFVPIGIVLGLIISVLGAGSKPKRRGKKGQIWVSTVLYVALGIVAITLILGAGLPMINKMKERNAVIEAKSVMHAISQSVTTVVTEGPGSRRILDPVIIKGGKLLFDVNGDFVRWDMKTSAKMMESCKPDYAGCKSADLIQREGELEVYLLETLVVDEYVITIDINYPGSINIAYSDENKIRGSLTGSHMIVITNEGSIQNANGVYITTVGVYIN